MKITTVKHILNMVNQLKFDEFLRSISISKDNSYSMLFGAGCSISSDIQSANDCIWEWKKMIYQTNNPNTQEWIDNYKNPKVQDSIQNWLNNQGSFIEKDSPEEYSFYAKKCFPIDENRRQYFQKICANKTPSIGYKTIPILVKHGILDSIWTTNFDDLIMSACFKGEVTGIDISLNTVERINQRTQSRNELPIIKLHGDFKYGDLKNTSEELQNQDEVLRKKFIDYLKDKHLIVLGYSGRDKSLMNSLKESYSEKGGGILFWCGYGDKPNNDVLDLLEHIKKNGRTAFYISIEGQGFDNAMLSITKLVVEGNSQLKSELDNLKKVIEVNRNIPFDFKPERFNKVLKSNLFSIEFPKEVLVADIDLGNKPWNKIKEKTFSQNSVVAVPYNKQLWAFGKIEEIQNAFKDCSLKELNRKPLTEIKIYNQNISHLMLCSLCKIFSSNNSFETNYKNKLWDKSKSVNILNQKIFYAIRLGLEKIENNYYLSINPDFHLEKNDIDKEIKQQIGLTFFHKIYNAEYNDYINDWRKKLLKENKFEFPMNSGTGFIFKIRNSPIFTNVLDLNNPYSNSHNVPPNLLKLKGIQFKETDLVFSTKNSNKKTFDTHPMRGLINNRPYDTNLHNLLDKTINLGVICPEQDSDKLIAFLNMQNQEIKKNNVNDNYIIDFKGFFNTYGISLNIPTKSSQSWEQINNPTETAKKNITHEIKRNICDKINKLNSVGSQKIIVIYIPKRWDGYLHYNSNAESFDLHDYIKAFCAEKGITSQIIREKTIIDKSLNCQINWWLSLSYFVKSFRTPWVINNADKDTAFAGIGYSVDNKNNNKGHIILGCSHIYSSDGEGLKYKLSKINDTITWINKKPHLSYDDAYEFGRNVINLFYESMNRVPKRVVIHKRTFYTDDEKQGILDSLFDSKKIENVDLIEINFEDNIRYVSSKIFNGVAEIDGFSVSRGTCIQLGNYEALLYAHGIIPSVRNPKYNFYPGGRYIPKPLRIIKHYGNGSLEQIANEILGLTKMNWNSLNMYSQLPATISSSNEIARIGKLIENTEKIQYDYRYFI